jgi:hypothetical protein
MEVSRTDEGEWKGSSRTANQKTAAKVKVNHGDVTSDWSFCNDKFTMALKGDPLASKDYPSSVALNLETKPQKGDHKAKLDFDVSTPDMSGVKLWENLQLEYNSKKEVIIRNRLSAQYDGQYSLGAHVEHDTVDF